MPYGTDRLGYGNCVPTKEESDSWSKAMKQVEEVVRIRNIPEYHRTQEERDKLEKHEKYGKF